MTAINKTANAHKMEVCPFGLHESWATFKGFDQRVMVLAVFVTGNNELLLTKDESGVWQLPQSKFSLRQILLNAPRDIVTKSLKIADPKSLLGERLGQGLSVMGQVETGNDLNVFVKAKVARPLWLPNASFFGSYTALALLEGQINQMVNLVAQSIWPEPAKVTA